jgi:hypothetical protein
VLGSRDRESWAGGSQRNPVDLGGVGRSSGWGQSSWASIGLGSAGFERERESWDDAGSTGFEVLRGRESVVGVGFPVGGGGDSGEGEKNEPK